MFLHFSERAAGEAGLTPAQHQLLLAVRGFPGPEDPSTSDVAEVLGLRNHSAVELIDRAIEADLVDRRPDPDDGRRRLLSLTDRGQALLAELSAAHRDELRRFREEMGDVLRELDP